MESNSENKENNFFADLLELTKPRLSSLVIITAAGGWWMAPVGTNSTSSWEKGAISVLLTTLTVAAANTLNNYLERESDKDMVRTQNRPLPTGRMKPATALIFGLILSFLAIPAMTLLVNPLSGLLAAIALISYVMVYTPLKRITSFHTIVGALPGAMPPLIGWTTVTNSLDIGGILLFSILFLWQIPHSLAITIYRSEEYKKAGLIVLSNDRGLEATRFQMLMWTFVIFPVPFLLFVSDVVGHCTLIVGSALGLWWLIQAWQGFSKGLGAKWARKFFFSSLIYLGMLFLVMSIDGIVKVFFQ